MLHEALGSREAIQPTLQLNNSTCSILFLLLPVHRDGKQKTLFKSVLRRPTQRSPGVGCMLFQAKSLVASRTYQNLAVRNDLTHCIPYMQDQGPCEVQTGAKIIDELYKSPTAQAEGIYPKP